jgi:hypothetical protein
MALHRLAKFLRNHGAKVSTICLPAGPKIGVDDFSASGHTIQDLLSLKSPDLPAMPKQTQAETLLTIAESRAELLYTDGTERLASVLYADGHREVYTIGEKGSSFRDWLLTEYQQENRKKPPSATALAQAMEPSGRQPGATAGRSMSLRAWLRMVANSTLTSPMGKGRPSKSMRTAGASSDNLLSISDALPACCRCRTQREADRSTCCSSCSGSTPTRKKRSLSPRGW